jgi:competence protein ComEC
MRKSVRIKSILILAFFLIAAAIWYAAWREDNRGQLTISFLSVGQGNAIFIEAPSGRKVLINGGPDASVLRRLGSVMAPWDRSLDIVVATDADAGDVSGLVDVLQRYTVGTVIQTSVENTSAMWNLFEKEAADAAAKGTTIRTALRGQVIDLGKGAYLEVLFPDRNLLNAGAGEGCVVMHMVYGSTSVMFPCDSTQGVQNYLAMLDGTKLKSEVLVSGATSSPIFLGYVAPTYIVVSRACNTTPALSADVQTFETCNGTITFVSDGKTIVRE